MTYHLQPRMTSRATLMSRNFRGITPPPLHESSARDAFESASVPTTTTFPSHRTTRTGVTSSAYLGKIVKNIPSCVDLVTPHLRDDRHERRPLEHASPSRESAPAEARKIARKVARGDERQERLRDVPRDIARRLEQAETVDDGTQ
jgi:hypothetical protein